MEDKEMQDHWLLVHFLNFSDEELRLKVGNSLPKVILELGLEFEYFKALIFPIHGFAYFDPSKLIKLANPPLHNILFLGTAKISQ